MKEPKKRGRPAKCEAEQKATVEKWEMPPIERDPIKNSGADPVLADEIADDVPEAIIYAKSVSAETLAAKGRETLDISVVYRVEAAIGRTANAWGMVDPLELIRAVDRVLRGGEGHE